MKTELDRYIKACVKDYCAFTGASDFPAFEVRTKHITLDKSKKQGFDSWAATFYDVPTGKHTLEVWENVFLPQLGADYLMFHELTHIADAEKYSQQDKLKHMSNRGYTEYHAAQIDFMKLLGVKKISDTFSFSMTQKFETVGGEKTALQFILAPHDLAVSLIERDDFPANIETLATTFGVIFNYYGRRAICKMHSTDFKDEIDNSAIEKFLGLDTVKALDTFMQGWFGPEKIAMIDMLYGRMVVSLAQKYKLG